MSKGLISAIIIGVGIVTAPQASAAVCNGAFVGSVISQMNTIQATSSSCRNALRAGLPDAQTCRVCSSTYAKLTSLRATYKANKSCFRSSPRIMGRVAQLWSYRSDIKTLRRKCG